MFSWFWNLLGRMLLKNTTKKVTILALRNMNILKSAPWKATKLKQPVNWKDTGEKTWNTWQDCLK